MKENYEYYLSRINRLKNTSQFTMFNSPEGTEDYGDKVKWTQDSSGLIETIFLPLHYPCGSYVIIDEDGNFYTHRGEYNRSNIIRQLNDKKNTFNNSTEN